MAMKTCKECGEEVSGSAKSCPKYGTWKYKAIGLVTEDVTSYKLVEVTGW